MPTQLPSGNWRPRVRNPRTGKQLNPQTIIGGPASYDDEEAAATAERKALKVLRTNARAGVIVREWWEEWTTEPLWLRPAESTNVLNRERTGHFVARYGDLPMRGVDDEVVREYRRSGKRDSTIPALRAMWNDAKRPDAGRLVESNPWAGLRLPRSRGRRDVQPPEEAEAARLIALADELTPPSFAAYLDVAIHEGMRSGELDGLRWPELDFTPGAETIKVEWQWNVKARKLTRPKHGVTREITMTPRARERLLTLSRESEWVFTTLQGTHYTPSSRSHHWNRVRCTAGLGNVDLYTATRHHFAWYAWNVLELSPEDIAQHFGHQDGGELVRKLYGHFDQVRARSRIREAFAKAPTTPVPLALVS